MKTKFHRTFLCGGVVLAVLNLCTKNLYHRDALESGQISRKCLQQTLLGTDMSFLNIIQFNPFLHICVMKFSIKAPLSCL